MVLRDATGLCCLLCFNSCSPRCRQGVTVDDKLHSRVSHQYSSEIAAHHRASAVRRNVKLAMLLLSLIYPSRWKTFPYTHTPRYRHIRCGFNIANPTYPHGTHNHIPPNTCKKRTHALNKLISTLVLIVFLLRGAVWYVLRECEKRISPLQTFAAGANKVEEVRHSCLTSSSAPAYD